MNEASAVVVGAGKIARGFIGHLLFLSGYRTTFVYVDERLVTLLDEHHGYHVHVLAAPEKDVRVERVNAFTPGDPRLAEALAEADLAFVSVGGANLGAAAESLARAIDGRLRCDAAPLDVVVCENWRHAAGRFRDALTSALGMEARARSERALGVAEATIMRSCIDPTPEQRLADPLAVQVQDFWTLEVDGDALRGSHPPVVGLTLVADFAHALERKLYTYNTGNATISYLGWLRGHRLLSDAANDPAIVEVAEGVYRETGAAISRRFGYPPDEQAAYALRSFEKFRAAEIVDPLERQVRDPLRKLGRHDRLVGAALACLEEGVEPREVALGIAAALRHRNPADPAAERLAALVEANGPCAALAEVGEVPLDSPLLPLVAERLRDLDRLTEALV